jgi:hypothetical protein
MSDVKFSDAKTSKHLSLLVETNSRKIDADTATKYADKTEFDTKFRAHLFIITVHPKLLHHR